MTYVDSFNTYNSQYNSDRNEFMKQVELLIANSQIITLGKYQTYQKGINSHE